MKKMIAAKSQIVKGSLQYLQGKVTKNRKTKLKGIINYLHGSAKSKLNNLKDWKKNKSNDRDVTAI